jgi:hypothetical protein
MTNELRALGVSLLGIALGASLGCGPGSTPNGSPDSGPLSCGVGPEPGYQGTSDGGQISDAGVVEFNPTVLGATDLFTIPVQDTADVDETLQSASFSGPGAAAFQVVATFPIPIPAGTPVNLEVEFTPTVAGTSTATLNLQTADMGVSPIQIEGVGVADGG